MSAKHASDGMGYIVDTVLVHEKIRVAHLNGDRKAARITRMCEQVQHCARQKLSVYHPLAEIEHFMLTEVNNVEELFAKMNGRPPVSFEELMDWDDNLSRLACLMEMTFCETEAEANLHAI